MTLPDATADADLREPSPWSSRRLWSLWDMLEKFEVGSMFELAANVGFFNHRVEDWKAKHGDVSLDQVTGGKGFAALAIVLANPPPAMREHFPSVARQCLRMSQLENSVLLSVLLREMEEFVRRFQEELGAAAFFHVTSNKELYDTPVLFGQDVNDKFPQAIDDIEEAGKCIALGRGTGAVLHLMRVMEVGLKQLAAMLAIPYAPSWESYLAQISNKIAAKHRTKGVKWKRDEPFFRDVSGDLMVIKQAWRNPTMHVVRKYGPEEAEQIFYAVKGLMQRLATKIAPHSSSGQSS